MAFSSSLIIEEIEGPKRVLTLRGGGLPFWGASWGFELGMTTTWYPGNGDEATQQVLGPREVPSNWSGEWSRVVLSRLPCTLREGASESQIVAPSVLKEAIEAIARPGIRLRVTWAVSGDRADQRYKIVREGRCKKGEFRFRGMHDIEWDLTFEWASRGGAKRTAISSREDSFFASTAAMVVQAETAISNLQTTLQVAKGDLKTPAAPTNFSLGQLEKLAQAPQKALRSVLRNLQQGTSNLRRLMGIASKLRALPFELANSVLDFGTNTLAIVNQFTDEMGRLPPELMTTQTKASDVTRAATRFGKSMDDLVEVARRAQDIALRFRQTVARGDLLPEPSAKQLAGAGQGRILAIHTVRSGDSPLTLSMRYFNNPDRVEDILRANRLPVYQTTLRVGQHVVIPALNAGPGSTSG